jgi:hypothetical protein
MPEIWAKVGNCGGLRISPVHIELKNKNEIVSRRQYPVPKEGKQGLQAVTEDGLLEACISPYNTPVLPVKTKM